MLWLKITGREIGCMSKTKNKKQRQADGFFISNERRITDECRQVYPALYKMQRVVFIITAIVWVITLVTPTFFAKYIESYSAWGSTYETVTLIASIVLLVAYIIANYFWQEKMKKFREKYEKRKKK